MTGIGLDVFPAPRRLCFYRRYLLSFCLFVSRIMQKLAHIPRKIPLIFDGNVRVRVGLGLLSCEGRYMPHIAPGKL